MIMGHEYIAMGSLGTMAWPGGSSREHHDVVGQALPLLEEHD
jgi:hypothetical protein